MRRLQKPKIAVFHCGFIYTGGGERIVMEEVLGLRKRGYKVDLFVPTYDPRLSYPDIIAKWKIKTFLPQLPRFFPLRFAIQIVASCILIPFLVTRFKKYDVILGANQPGAYLAWMVSKILGKPYIVYLSQPNRVLYPRDHENWQNVADYYYLNKIINTFVKPLVSLMDKKSITGGNNLLINGGFVAKEIVKIYKPDNWMVCTGGAHPISNNAIKNDRFKGKVKLNGHTVKKPYILYTSRHEPWKKFDWAIKVMSLVVKKNKMVKLIIPGAETKVTPKLKKLAKKLGIGNNIIFLGVISDKTLWKLYMSAAVYIFTSPKEDLGVVVEEAQAAGVPVVAWNKGGPTITVESNKTGYLIPPYNKKLMARKISLLLKNKNLRNKIGRQAWRHIQKNLSWEKHVDIVEKELLRAI